MITAQQNHCQSCCPSQSGTVQVHLSAWAVATREARGQRVEARVGRAGVAPRPAKVVQDRETTEYVPQKTIAS